MRTPAADYGLDISSPAARFRGILAAAFGFCLFLLFGCGSEAASPTPATVRDSAGVTIVENHGSVPPNAPQWTLSQEPTFVIGSLDGPEQSQLYRVQGAFRLPDGRIAVGNRGTSQIRIFGPDGRHLASHGGEGEGPGEFSFVLLAGRVGDSLVVMDRQLRRISLIHPGEGFVRSFTPEEAIGTYLMGGWVLGDGAMLFRDLFLGDEEQDLADGFQRGPLPLKTGDMEGNLITDLGHFPGAEQVLSTRRTDHGIATVLMSVPFGKSPQIAVAGGRMYFGSQDSYEVGVYGSEGSLTRLIRLDRPSVPVSDADLAAFMASEVEDMDENEARDRRQELEEMPRIDFRPAFGSIAADEDGYVFVEDFHLPGEESSQWNVFDPEGRLTGRLHLPAGVTVLEIGRDYLLGLYRDDMEVEYLKMYSLERPAGG